MPPRRRIRTAAGTSTLPALLLAIGFAVDAAGGTYRSPTGHVIRVVYDAVDWRLSTINYGPDIVVGHAGTSNFSQPETLVVLQCVCDLLRRGYSPSAIELERTWTLGHNNSGRLDVLLKAPDGSPYAMIECKTWGREYAKERNNTLEDGGQLFSYLVQDRRACALYLYSARIAETGVEVLTELVRTGGLVGTNLDELHRSWTGTWEPAGLFHPDAAAYDDAYRGIRRRDLKDLDRESGMGVFNSFAEILRRHVVSDKSNAFNKIFNLFLAKIADEDSAQDDEDMQFQWRFGDTGAALLGRLTSLYKRGLADYLRIEVQEPHFSPSAEFGFVEVYDATTQERNLSVLREVVELLQAFKIRYSTRQQYLGDFFEMLLSTGVKQEAGQFFTPVPLARAILRSLPLDAIMDTKVAERRADVLPYVIDFACGAGHFLTEAIVEIHAASERLAGAPLTARARTKFVAGRDAFQWAAEFVYGVEKDHRLAKVTKIATFLNGDGDANILQADGLAPFTAQSGFVGQLVGGDGRDLAKFDVVVANPPFSVSNFRRDLSRGAERFRLYGTLTPDSGEIECLFLERASQLLADGGVAGIIFPLSLLNNTRLVYRGARRILAIDFEIVGMLELREKTFIATPTTTVCLFLRRRPRAAALGACRTLIALEETTKQVLQAKGLHPDRVRAVIESLPAPEAERLLEVGYDDDFVAHAIRAVAAEEGPVVVGYTGETTRQQECVLGYRFSRTRGSEGCVPIEEGGAIQSLLFDPAGYPAGRFATHVRARFMRQPVPVPDTASAFLRQVDVQTVWKVDGTLCNPSSYFVTEATVRSYNPLGDVIDELPVDEIPLGSWLEATGVVVLKGATYPKAEEVPSVTATKILTASNMDLATRALVLAETRHLRTANHVSAAQRPRPGDIIVCTASGSLSHLGKIVVVDAPVDAYIGGFLCIIRAPDGYTRTVVEHNLLSARFRRAIAAGKEQNISNLTERKLRAFPIRAPEKDELREYLEARGCPIPGDW